MEETIERQEGREEEEIAHKLRLDGKAGRVREAEGIRGAAWTEKSSSPVDASHVEDTLEKAKETDEKGDREIDIDHNSVVIFTTLFGRIELIDGGDRNKDAPENTGSESAAKDILGPAKRNSRIDRDGKDEEGFFPWPRGDEAAELWDTKKRKQG